MKKIKKLLAMIMAMTMVLGMAMTVSAAPQEDGEAYINIYDDQAQEHLSSGSFRYLQIINADPTTRTGWAFTHGAEQFVRVFLGDSAENTPDNQQTVIDMLIDHAAGYEDYTSQFSKALSAVAVLSHSTMSNPQTVTSAGIYSIRGTEEGYIYNNMAAFVSFGKVEDANYPTLTDAVLVAKKTPTSVDKELETDDGNNVVAIGDIITYTIETWVPYIAPTATNKEFYIYDDIDGADYYLEGEGAHKSVILGVDEDITNNVVFDISGDEGYGLYIDLSDLIDDANSNAGKKIVVTYTAKVTEVDVNNTAGSNAGDSEFDSDTVDVYTGQIVLTKYNEDKTKTLAGAGFEVRKDNEGDALKFSEVTTGVDGNYVYDPVAGTITEVKTGSDGTLTIAGLDLGHYTFKEVTAPKGYHIANSPDGIDAEAALSAQGTVTETVKATTSLTNTKLSSLPSTGGIGTTIFTIGGCAIMIAAAALYFVNRRKSEEN